MGAKKFSQKKFLIWKIPTAFLVLAGIFFVRPLITYSSTDARKNELRKQLEAIEQQISQYQSRVNDIRQQEKSLEREVALLENEVREVQLQIDAINLSLEDVYNSMKEKDKEIVSASFSMEQEKSSLAENIRLFNEADQESLLETLMKNQELSSFFDTVNSLENFQNNLKEKIKNIRDLRSKLKGEEANLEEQKIQFNQLKVLQQVQQMAVVEKQKEKEDILGQTKGRESVYKQMMDSAKKDAAAIRSQLFQLAGGGAAMTLEQAFNYAQLASAKTGIRPAFLLALLKKETQWGLLQGTGNWRTDMNPQEQPAFIRICQELNLDPDQVAVSKAPSYGWGGAMGPAQFIPRTWLGIKDKVAELTGHSPASPWNTEDAFTAAACKLTAAGAAGGNRAGEWKAAQIYFAGGNWNKPSYSFYGNSIMEMADSLQDQLQAAGLL